MALKTDFEATSDIASPFVDEVANPGITLAHAKDLVRVNKTNKIISAFLDSKGTKAKKQ